jgi:hypothetical protein
LSRHQSGSEIAGTIVRAAGLDDRVATPLDMDAKDLRFGEMIVKKKLRITKRRWYFFTMQNANTPAFF